MDAAMREELAGFIDSWTQDDNGTKNCFLKFKQYLEDMEGVSLNLVARPGVSYSLRAVHANQKRRQLFAMVDVIDDDPADRWLSVCFYGEMINDPEEQGDDVPEGLLGEDATCFDVYTYDDELVNYVLERLGEACQSAAQEEEEAVLQNS